MEKAKEALKEGTSLVWHHIKLIRLADKLEFERETVNQYEADELTSNSEDDRPIYRSESLRVERKHEEKRRKKSPPVKSSFSSTSTLSAPYPIHHLQQRSVAIILGSLFCLREIWPPSNQVSPKGSVSAYEPCRCEVQVSRMDSRTCVDSDNCLFDCAFFRDFEM